ncbi:MAG: 50S ribosomal protein L23 [Francisellaceae bacterium]|jgi:large subunit ribosomal protein L23|nr:50S ribosomal protein L23 [Francisellaceae bacterium]MBT6539127.1 50S ribosomal protein L23 [Francisellaceae bacterium]
MNLERMYKIILGPHTTEKSYRIADKNRQVVFKVTRDANKIEVKKAVEKIFGVIVSSVCIINVKGKVKGFKRVSGKTSAWKKAIVSLQEGHDINLAEIK